MQGVLFDDKHSYRDFNLITNTLKVGVPSVKTNYIDIPFGDGALDLTEAVGGVKYGNRTITFDFTLKSAPEHAKSNITNYMHGKKMKIILDKDLDYYYVGRCHVSEFNTDRNLSTVAITAECEPYKYKLLPTVHMEIIEGKKNFICINGGKTVTPTIELTDTMRVGVDGKLYELQAGKHKVLEIQLAQGYSRMTAIGSGTITLTYQEGVL